MGSSRAKFLTDSVSSGLAAVVKQRHVSQTVAVVDVAAALQDLRGEGGWSFWSIAQTPQLKPDITD